MRLNIEKTDRYNRTPSQKEGDRLRIAKQTAEYKLRNDVDERSFQCSDIFNPPVFVRKRRPS